MGARQVPTRRLTDDDTLVVDSAQVGIFKEGDKVFLAGLREVTNGQGLELEFELIIV